MCQIIFGVEHKYFCFNMIGDIGIRGPPGLRLIRSYKKWAIFIFFNK